jgi:hypothetical protein
MVEILYFFPELGCVLFVLLAASIAVFPNLFFCGGTLKVSFHILRKPLPVKTFRPGKFDSRQKN